MTHWIMAPVLLPMFAAAFIVFMARRNPGLAGLVSFTATCLLVLMTLVLMGIAVDEGYRVYTLGGWPAPFGIVLVLDRLSALMLLLTATLALASLAHALAVNEPSSSTFHVLFQFQIMGLNGAFLTGDLFNLFVFFEILLAASYGLLLAGGGRDRVRAALHYVIVNLVGSLIFLIALGVIYGTIGTLNMAHMAERVAGLSGSDLTLLRAGALMLLVVFALKAAALPLYLWLPATYSSATAAVAGLFALMTKVGAYSIIRVFSTGFGGADNPVIEMIQDWMLPVALATIVFGAIGALSCDTLRRLAAYLVIVSVGTLLVALAIPGADALAAALYYMVHSTLLGAAMFLVADLIAASRGAVTDRLLESGPRIQQEGVLGSIFFVVAIALAGMPPLSGFIGKAMILSSALGDAQWAWVLGIVLVTSLLTIVALSRAGSQLFWKTQGEAAPAAQVNGDRLLPAGGLALVSPLLVVFAGSVDDYMSDTAKRLLDPTEYIERVLEQGRDAMGGYR